MCLQKKLFWKSYDMNNRSKSSLGDIQSRKKKIEWLIFLLLKNELNDWLLRFKFAEMYYVMEGAFEGFKIPK